MEAVHKFLYEFMGSKNDFIIPVYQRNYDWKEENTKTLFESLLFILKEDLKEDLEEYFIGAFTVVNERSNKLLLIDGQQRFTTISLFLLAIHNLLKAGDIQTEKEDLKDEILDDYLKHPRKKEEYVKLKQVNQDSSAYEGLFEIEKYKNEWKTSNIYKNYNYLKEAILEFCKDEKKDVKLLYEAFKKIKIVNIELFPPKDRPQLVFETINATGKKLSDADLIRNYILMDKTNDQQKELFENYWTAIEQNTRYEEEKKTREETTKFIWYFLMCEKSQNLKETDTYKNFRAYINENYKEQEKLKEFLQKAKRFSEYYKWFSCPDKCNNIYKSYFQTLQDLNQATCFPYLLSLMDWWEQDKSRSLNVHTILEFIIHYYVRRNICKEKTNVYNYFFPLIAKRIDNQENDDSYLENFYRVFANENSAFVPTDPQVKASLQSIGLDFYKLNSCQWIFEKLVNQDSQNSEDKIKMGDIIIEHVMPEKLTDDWRRMLKIRDEKTDVEAIHNNYLHNLGNLTVTGYNSKLGNRTFKEKKGIYLNRPIAINRDFENIEIWDKKTIQERTKKLAIKICEILKHQDLKKYKTQTAISEAYISLEAAIDLTKTRKGLDPLEFKIYEESYHLKKRNWNVLITKVATVLYKLDIKIFEKMVDDPYIRFIANREFNIRDVKIAYGIFLNTNNSSFDTMKKIKKMLQEYDLEAAFKIKITNK